jgi:DNA-directed RNA polymerase beta subunit
MAREFGEGLTHAFPIVTPDKKAVAITAVHVPTMLDPTDYNAQKDTIMKGGTWGVPVKATVAMHDAKGKVTSKHDVRVGFLPTPTNRHTFIINGKEYQVNMQRRLRPGVYTKFNQLGQATADFNLGKGRNFALALDPEKNQVEMKFGSSRVPLLPVLKHVFGKTTLGLGKAFDAPMGADAELTALKDLHALVLKNQTVPSDKTGIVHGLQDYFQATQLEPAVTKLVVGEAHSNVNGDVLQLAAKQLLAVHKREVDPSGKDQMAFTEVHGVEDFLRERVQKNRGMIGYKLRPRIEKYDDVRELKLHQYVQPLIDDFFTKSAQSNHVMQINPLEMKENAYKLSSLGEGAIGDTHAVTPEVRVIHPSSMGFIDPVRTPDNAKAGVDVRLALGASKVGKNLLIDVQDRNGEFVSMSPEKLYDKVVAHDKEPVENGLVRAIHRGQLVDVSPSKVDYRLQADRQFTVSTTLVPFLANTHAHRAAMGAKMLGQAVSLVDREPPIVDTPHSEIAGEFASLRSPVAGTVSKIEKGVIHIKSGDTTHKVNFPYEFPLNGHSFLHATPVVKAGDTVTKNQLLADTNFTQNGQLALGKNLTVAYLPMKGLNHEDAVVVTRSGAAKLTSQHQHIEEVEIDGRSVHDKKKFQAHFPGRFELQHLGKLDDQGVVKVGTRLQEGDPILASLRKRLMSPEQLLLGKANKGLVEPFSDTSVTWDKPYEGRVTGVEKTSKGIKVSISAVATLQEGDKLCGRHGNKGVVAAIIPDAEAPRTADGKVPDVILNSAGLTSRMNNGQIYEVVAAKALQALGKAGQKFPHFAGVNTHQLVKMLRDKAGISETEQLYDGTTGRKLGGPVLMGPMYMLKLFKQAETGFSARSGGDYDIDLRPTKGGEEGAKSVGHLDLYGLLAHGARAFVRDAHMKSEYNPEVLTAMWKGQPLPPPKPTFAFKKFEAMLGGMGVNVKKEGHTLQLLPQTDAETLARSSGPIVRPLTVNDKPDPVTNLPFRPEAGGLFDPNATGGLVGTRWSHIPLAEPIVNPLFHNAARTLLGLTKDEFNANLYDRGAVHVKQQLAAIDVPARIDELKHQLVNTNAVSKRDGIHKQLKYLTALHKSGLRPEDAYIMHHVPVVPPHVRPIYPDPDTGRLVVSDANVLYKNLMLVNDQLAQHKNLGDADTIRALRHGLNDAFAKVQGLDAPAEQMSKEKPAVGFLKVITGTGQAKDGFFQAKLVSRRQDIAGRGVVVPDTSLGIDELGVPKAMAWKIYRNHGIGELVQSGMPLVAAAREFEDQTPTAEKAVLSAMKKFPTVISRAPSLHKFNIAAFRPRMVEGKSLRVNTLVLKGFNMDFDGDQVNVHVPISPEGAKDAVTRMLPSANLYNPLNSAPIHVPSQETVLGLWKATNVAGKPPVRSFATQQEATAAYRRGEIGITDPISIG